MTASPGASYQNDLLGNRTWKNYQQAGVQRYVWDELGRLSSLCGTSQGAKYTYRVDGLRIKKVEGLTIEWVDDGSGESEEESSGYYDEHWATNKPTTRYFYDGQMSFEDDYTVVSGGFGTPDVTVTRYALGARGIDGIETTTSSGASAVYPVYDGHGNMIATLSRNGSSFTRANNRAFDAWGNITSGSGGDQGYVANLGHRRDVESGLTYMRARYYEPGTGKFISEDRSRHGPNWFMYCSNDPANHLDFDGNSDLADYEVLRALGLASTVLAIGSVTLYSPAYAASTVFLTVAVHLASHAVLFYSAALGGGYLGERAGLWTGLIVGYGFDKMMMALLPSAARGSQSAAGIAVIAATAYTFMLMAALIHAGEGS